MNLGIGLGGLAGGLIASTATRASRALFLLDAAHLRRLRRRAVVFVPDPARPASRPRRARHATATSSATASSWRVIVAQLALHRGRDRPARGPPGVREERGRASASAGSAALLREHDRDRAAAAADRAARRGPAADAALALLGARLGGRAGCSFRLGGLGSTGAAAFALLAVAVAVFAHRRVPARRRPAGARRRPRRPPADRALHGDVGALLAGRLHGRPGGRAASLLAVVADRPLARRRVASLVRRRSRRCARARAARGRPAHAARRPRRGAGRARGRAAEPETLEAAG